MVENTWAWAKGQGKVYTHPINKAEYVDLDVEKCRETQHARVREKCFFFGIPTEGHVQSAIDLEYF